MFPCSHNKDCNYNSSDRKDLIAHYKCEHNRYLCHGCDNHYGSTEYRRKHNVSAHKNLCYQCNGCDRSYSRHDGYQHHHTRNPTCGSGYLIIPKESSEKLKKELGTAAAVSDNLISQGKFVPNPAHNPTFSQVATYTDTLNETFKRKTDNNSSNETRKEYCIENHSGMNLITLYHS